MPRASAESLVELEAAVTADHLAAIRSYLADQGLDPAVIDLVGLHGQTICHCPEQCFARQLIDDQAVADALGVPAVDRFRDADVAAGREGAHPRGSRRRLYGEPVLRPAGAEIAGSQRFPSPCPGRRGALRCRWRRDAGGLHRREHRGGAAPCTAPAEALARRRRRPAQPALHGAACRAAGGRVDPVEAVGWNGNALEAQIFAYFRDPFGQAAAPQPSLHDRCATAADGRAAASAPSVPLDGAVLRHLEDEGRVPESHSKEMVTVAAAQQRLRRRGERIGGSAGCSQRG